MEKIRLERDNFICQKTGQSGGKLHVHHINNFSEFIELRFSIDNGINFIGKNHTDYSIKYMVILITPENN